MFAHRQEDLHGSRGGLVIHHGTGVPGVERDLLEKAPLERCERLLNPGTRQSYGINNPYLKVLGPWKIN